MRVLHKWLTRRAPRAVVRSRGSASGGNETKQSSQAWKAHIDYKAIQSNAEKVKANVQARKANADVDRVLSLYSHWLEQHAEADRLRTERNNMANLMKGDVSNEEKEHLKEEGRMLKDKIAQLEEEVEQTEAELQSEALLIPNDTHPDVPVGDEESSASVFNEFGHAPAFDFTPQDHTALSDIIGLADFDAGSRVSGAKFAYLQGYGAMLEMALINFTFMHIVQQGYIPYMTPDMVRKDVVEKCGFNPRGESSQVYNIEQHDLSMAGTAEIPLGGIYEDQILENSQLPIRMAGFGHCFRTEAGASGAATRGLYRLHQFSKLELFVICAAEDSESMHEELLSIEEDIFSSLGLHFRTIDMPTEDLGAPAYRKYDIEANMPGLKRWGEISSATNCTDFQSRRLNTRFRRPPPPGKKKGKPEYVHTLNATAIAVPRTIIALVEQNQNSDGSVNVPGALQPYLGGLRVLQPSSDLNASYDFTEVPTAR